MSSPLLIAILWLTAALACSCGVKGDPVPPMHDYPDRANPGLMVNPSNVPSPLSEHPIKRPSIIQQ
jgi:hypothetical protein